MNCSNHIVNRLLEGSPDEFDAKQSLLSLPDIPKKWGDLKVGDVLFDYETHSVQIITGQGSPYVAHTARVFYTEYNPAYEYGHYVQHLSVRPSEPIIGAYLVGMGAATEFKDFWELRRKLSAREDAIKERADRKDIRENSPDDISLAKQEILHALDRGRILGKHRIAISFYTITPESAARCEYAEQKWENKDGVSMEPDRNDEEDGLTAADLAARFLYNHGANCEDSGWHPGVCYESGPDQDYRSGSEKFWTYHLVGFSDVEEEQVFNALNQRRQRP